MLTQAPARRPCQLYGQGMHGCNRVSAKCFRPAAPASRRTSVKSRSKFGDELLDFVTAGPKLRKWYGQGQLPQDGGGFEPEEPDPQEEEGDDGAREGILVTDAESPTGEQVLLQLILSRAQVKAVFNNVAKAKVSYGPYVTPISLDVGDKRAVQKALKGVKAAVVSGRLGCLHQVAAQAGLQHIVLISSAGLQGSGQFSLGSLFGSADGVLGDPSREAAVLSTGIPCTIVKAANIQDAPGGTSSLKLFQDRTGTADTSVVKSTISRQDVALVAVKALEHVPAGSLTFQVATVGPGTPPSNWEGVFASLAKGSAVSEASSRA